MNAMVKASATVGKFVLKHRTTILACAAIMGVGATAYTSGKAAVKASRDLEELNYTSDHTPTMVEKVKCVAPDVLPAALMGATTVACIIGLHKMHLSNTAAMAAACTAWQTKYGDLNETLVENLGKKKTENLKDKAAQKSVDRDFNDPECGMNVIRTRFGNVLFKDSFSGRYFYSSYEAVNQAAIDLTADAQNYIYVTLNRLYDLLEIPQTDAGDHFGWNICDIQEDFEARQRIQIFTNRTTQTPEPYCLPCTVVDYDPEELVKFD